MAKYRGCIEKPLGTAKLDCRPVQGCGLQVSQSLDSHSDSAVKFNTNLHKKIVILRYDHCE